MTNEFNAHRLPPDEEAERQAFHRDVPIWARAKELGIRFSDSQGHLLSTPTTEAAYAARQKRIDQLLAQVHQKIGVTTAPTPAAVPRHIPVQPEAEPFWSARKKRLLALAAAFIAGLSLEPAMAAHDQYEHNQQSKLEQRALGTSAQTIYPMRTGQTFDIDDHSVRGAVHHGDLIIGSIGSAADSAVSANLGESSDATIDLEPNTHGMLLGTPTAEVELLLPGRYEISSRVKDVGSIRVDSGLAVIRAKKGTEHDWTIVHAGEEVQTRIGQLTIRHKIRP